VFVPIAEQTGVIEQMTDVLLRKACTHRRQAWPSHLMLGFNLSAYQLDKPNAGLKTHRDALAECNFPPRRFEAEMTETAIMKDRAGRTPDHREPEGGGRAASALDDFGTGYSSLSHDQGSAARQDQDRQELCRPHLLGRQDRQHRPLDHQHVRVLDLGCVAEGIEERDQLKRLKLEGCNHGQGYLFSRPLPQAEAERLMAEILSAIQPTARKATRAA
jgi:EAL domain-containing protein (putative c-di-GMP-specific phosphodiesterase class I)